MRILHSEPRGLAVHHLHESFSRAADVLGDRDRGVVGRVHHDRLHHVVERKRLAFLEIDLRTAHRGRVARGRDPVAGFETAVGEFLRDDHRDHHLGQRRGGPRLVLVVLEHHGPGLGFHQERGGVWRGELIRLGGRGGRGGMRSPLARERGRRRHHRKHSHRRGNDGKRSQHGREPAALRGAK